MVHAMCSLHHRHEVRWFKVFGSHVVMQSGNRRLFFDLFCVSFGKSETKMCAMNASYFSHWIFDDDPGPGVIALRVPWNMSEWGFRGGR